MSLATFLSFVSIFSIHILWAQLDTKVLLEKSEAGTENIHLEYAKKAYQVAGTDSFKTRALDRIAVIHYLNDSLNLFLNASRNGLESAKKRNDEWGIARFHYNLGAYYRRINVFDSAYFHHFEASKGFKKIGDSLEVVKNLLNLSIMSASIGDYVQSENEAIEGLNYLKGKEEPVLKSSLYNNLGISFVEREDYDRAVYWYMRSREGASSNKKLIIVYNNLGVVKRREGEYKGAHEYFKQALTYCGDVSLDQYQAMVEDNLGYTEFLLYDRGLAMMKKGYQRRKKKQNTYGEIINELHLAEYYQKLGGGEVEKLLRSSYQKAKSIGNTKNELKSLRLLTEYFGNPQDLHLYLSLRDSIEISNENLRSRHASIRFETKQKELRNVQLEQERSEKELALVKEKRFTSYLIISIVGLLVTLFLVYRWFKTRKKRLEMQSRIRVMESRFEEQDKISYLLHQDIANDLLLNIDQLDVVSTRVENKDLPKIIDELESVYKRTVGISRDLGRHEFNKRSFKRNIHFLVKEYMIGSRREIQVSGLDDLDEGLIGKTILYESYLVLKELLSNVKKYSGATEVKILFSHDKSMYTMTCTDNGSGIKGTDGRGIGLSAMKGRIESHLKGIFEVISNSEGTRIEIKIPLH